MLQNDFHDMDVELLTEQIDERNEGPFHSGTARFIRIIVKKISV
jgi:hypothetical protein